MKLQKQYFIESQSKIFESNRHFFELVSDPVNPLTNADLAKLVKRFPQRWVRFAGFIGKLEY